MLVRASNAQFPNQFALGPGVTGIANWPTPITDNGGDPVDLRIVLNTTTPLWSVEWLAKKPADATYTSLGTASYTTNPTIRDITIADNYNIAGSIDSLTLTTSGLVYTAGDTNGNGVVDLFDYDTIRNNFFKSLQGPTNGDLNNDGVVDYVDFRVWKNHATPAALAALGIPEPASALLGVIGFVLLAPLSMRSRRR